MVVFQGLIGIAGLIALAWALSENRRLFLGERRRWDWWCRSCWHCC